jgi:hypothetical protein
LCNLCDHLHLNTKIIGVMKIVIPHVMNLVKQIENVMNLVK